MRSMPMEGSGDPRPSRIVLMSPMIGVAPSSRGCARNQHAGPAPRIRKGAVARHVSRIQPLQSTTSFPANAGLQTWRLTTTLQRQLARIAEAGRAQQIPPLLTFQSSSIRPSDTRLSSMRSMT